MNNNEVSNAPVRKTKTFKVQKNEKGEYTFVGRGKPAANSVRAEVVLPTNHNRADGIPAGTPVINERTVTYVKAIPAQAV